MDRTRGIVNLDAEKKGICMAQFKTWFVCSRKKEDISIRVRQKENVGPPEAASCKNSMEVVDFFLNIEFHFMCSLKIYSKCILIRVGTGQLFSLMGILF